MASTIETARALISSLNSWTVESIDPVPTMLELWQVTLGSTPRIVGDLLPGFQAGEAEGTVFPLEPREGAAEFDETVLLRRAPTDVPGSECPGIVMWGVLTTAYESRDGGTFEGVIAFYEDEAAGDAIMSVAGTKTSRIIVERSLREIETSIDMLAGNGAHVVPHADRILSQMARLNAILQSGLKEREAAE
ncbi:hypothetical protein [Sphingomonas sp. 3-13AW]|uniref:hypothetical protein n=1 Tax=Sphingomonas sp. 3-13AW TaxID=3050450 RepID=UPI003BB62298